MNNTFKFLGSGLVIGMVMGAGGAWGWMTLTAPPPEIPVEPTIVKPERIVKVVDEQALYEARRQIDELKRQLATSDQMATEMDPQQPKVVKAPPVDMKDIAGQVQSFVDSVMTPEQQAAMQAQRDAFRASMQKRVTERSDFLAAIDTTNMNPKQRATHDKLVASATRMNELWAASQDNKAENASEVRKEMHELGHSMEDLYKDERTTLLEITGKNMGYKGEQAQQFAEQIQTIYDNTSSRSMWGGGHRGGGGTGGGPGGGR